MGVVGSRRSRLISGFVAVVALAASGEALAQRQQSSCPADLAQALRASGNRAVTSVANSPVGLITNQIANGDAATVSQVRATCQRELRSGANRAHNVEAYMCVGDATLRLAELDSGNRDQHYRCGVEIFQRTADLAARAGASGNEARGDAHAKRAQTLLARRSMRSAETPEAAELLTAAIAAYNDAIQANPTAARRFALGRAYLSVDDGANGEREILAGQAMAPTGADTAMALVALAQYKTAHGATAQQVLPYLQNANRAAANSSSVNAALGVAYYQMGNYRDAETAFRTAVSPNAVDDIGGSNGRAESYYYLSVLGARAASTPAQWEQVIDNAQRAGGGELRFRIQECLAHIARGGESVRNARVRDRVTTEGRRACDIDNTPEGQLLRGMFFVREAQSFNVRIGNVDAVMMNTPERAAYQGAIADATRAFNDGLNAAQRLPEDATLSWPNYGTARVRDLLEYGAWVLAYECAGAPARPDLRDDWRRPRRAFFGARFTTCRAS